MDGGPAGFALRAPRARPQSPACSCLHTEAPWYMPHVVLGEVGVGGVPGPNNGKGEGPWRQGLKSPA